MLLPTPQVNSQASQHDVNTVLGDLRRFFMAGNTRNTAFRKQSLQRLLSEIRNREADIASALKSDLGKSDREAYLTETGMVLREIRIQIRNLGRWSGPQRVPTPFYLWPSSSRIVHEPLGVALLMAPWNYPFQMVMAPLVGAIAAGCCVLIKPSPDAPATAALMNEIVGSVFDPGHVRLLQGGVPLAQEVLRQRFDVIFFTGSPTVGRIVMRAAAEHLTPVILELGGKSPCIVDHDADLKVAARRIAWGKMLNAGQTCIAPDYILVHQSIKDAFIGALRQAFGELLGQDSRSNPHYARIIDAASHQRLQEMLDDAPQLYGGACSRESRFIEPTVLDEPPEDSALRSREIFGPLLPVYAFNTIDEAVQRINNGEKPLALYVFASKKVAEDVIGRTSSGGVCINDTVMHIANPYLPFGGVGESGMGRYRGRYSFEAFSHRKPVLSSAKSFDPPMRYPPYRWFNLIKRLL